MEGNSPCGAQAPIAPRSSSAAQTDFKRKFGLKARLSLIVVIAFTPVALAVGWLISQSSADAIRTGEAELLRATMVAGEQQGDLLESARDVLTLLAVAPLDSPESCTAQLVQAVTRFDWLASTAAFLPNGRPICASHAVPESPDIVSQTFFRRALSRREFTVADLRRGEVSGVPIVSAAMPVIAPDGSISHVLTVTIRAAWFEHTLRTGNLPRGSVAALFDSIGTVIAQVDILNVPDPSSLFR